METGTTAAEVKGAIQSGQIITYTLDAGQSQPMILIMDSPNHDVTLGVFERTAICCLIRPTSGRAGRGCCPDRTIQDPGDRRRDDGELHPGPPSGPTGQFRLRNQLHQPWAAQPQMDTVFSYALNASANQTMTVTLNVPPARPISTSWAYQRYDPELCNQSKPGQASCRKRRIM